MVYVKTVFYKSSTLHQLSEIYDSGAGYKALYSDKECLNKIGYMFINYTRDFINSENIVYDINKTFYILKDIYKITYVKFNNDKIVSPILFYNNWQQKTDTIGTIERIILDDEIVRQININLNE
jgi:hypothetical protein